MANKKAKLIYIISQGHSGSTLLDLICGTLPSVFSMGEMHFFSWQLKQGEVPEDLQTYCSCGMSFDKCEFWSNVLKQINDEYQIDIYKNPERFNISINRGIVRHKKYMVHNLLNKAYSYAMRNSRFSFVNEIIYLFYKKSIKNTWSLYDKVAENSNCSFVVDSSKNFVRYMLLKRFRPNDVKMIVLKRDIKGVASSSHHGLNEYVIRKRAKGWNKFYNKKIPALLSGLSEEEYMVVKYEDMCRDYNELRRNVANWLKIEGNIDDINHISPYNYHTVQGNPMRLLKKDIKIRFDERWKERLSEEQINWLNNLIE
ncbi:MAG: sulfotransferase [Zunongwangia sp.]|uniref:sulfotransferase n=1 Tax=Zunongwangia sp. TaxID=1965325 RepID=UPI0032424C25